MKGGGLSNLGEILYVYVLDDSLDGAYPICFISLII